MMVEVESLKAKFQVANRTINQATESFLLPRALDEQSTLESMVEACLRFYRLYPPPARQDNRYSWPCIRIVPGATPRRLPKDVRLLLRREACISGLSLSQPCEEIS